jgi:hypothetical protein
MNTVKDSFKMLNENSRLYNRVVQINTDFFQRPKDKKPYGTRMNAHKHGSLAEKKRNGKAIPWAGDQAPPNSLSFPPADTRNPPFAPLY